ncbi:hypothetical protein J3F84DRAFT_389935 [Trichoderma pleuroticola]
MRDWHKYFQANPQKEHDWKDFVQLLRVSLSVTEPRDVMRDSLTSFHKNGMYSSSATITNATEAYDIIDFLAIMQTRRIDMIPASWFPEFDAQVGGTASILEGWSATAPDGHKVSYVYKRVHRETSKEADRSKEYRALMAEIYILGHPVVRHHPNIIGLEGVYWDTVYGEAWPVLIFKRASYGDLRQFMKSEEGKKLGFKERLKLCREIANALLLMHSCHAIHGDLKPDNILIFKDVEGEYSAKVADFGYSTLFAQDIDVAEVVLPTSWPWTAPEIEDCSTVTFEQAKQADLFSFGLICLWTLSHDVLPHGQSQGQNEPDPHIMWEWKRRGNLPLYAATNVCMTIPDLNYENGKWVIAIDCIFDNCLALCRDNRKLELEWLSASFGCYQEPLPLIDIYSKSIPGLSDSSFDLISAFSEFRASGQSTWATVFRSLEARAQHHIDSTARAVAAYQVAFCYLVGFGTPMDKRESQSWIQKSNRTQADLDDAVQMIREDTSFIFKNITVSLDYFDQVRPLNDQSRNTKGILDADNTDSSQESLTGFSTKNILEASMIARIANSLDNTEPREIKMRIDPTVYHSEESCRERLAELMSQQLGVPATDMSFTNMKFLINPDCKSSVFPIEYSNENAERQTDQTSPEKEDKLVLNVQRKRRIFGPEHPDTLRSMDTLSQFYIQHERMPEALPLQIQTMDSQKVNLGREHPLALKAMEKTAALYFLLGNYKECETILLEVLELEKRVLGVKHVNTSGILYLLGDLSVAYSSNGMVEDAVRITEIILETRKKALGKEDESTLKVIFSLALLHYRKKFRLNKATEILENAIKIAETSLSRGHLLTMELMHLLAAVYLARHERHESGMIGKIHDIDKKIKQVISRGAVSRPTMSNFPGADDDQRRRDLYINVGQPVSNFVTQNINQDLVEDGIRQAERALELLDDASPDRSNALAKISNAYMFKFDCYSDLEDLDIAAVWAEQAAIVLSEDDAHLAFQFEALGKIYKIRYDITDEMGDLESCIQCYEKSVMFTLGGDEKLGERLYLLAFFLNEKYDLTMDTEALDLAIIWMEQVVDIAIGKFAVYGSFLLSEWLKSRFMMLRSQEDIDNAIDVLKRAEVLILNDTSEDHYRMRLAALYETRFEECGHSLEDINESICEVEKAVKAVEHPKEKAPTSDDNYGLSLCNLSRAHLKRYIHFRTLGDINKAAEKIDIAIQLIQPESSLRQGVMETHAQVHGLLNQAWKDKK